MKKRKRQTGEPAVDPSPTPLEAGGPLPASASLPHLEREFQDQDVRIWSVQYVPELYTVDRSLQRKPKKVVKV